MRAEEVVAEDEVKERLASMGKSGQKPKDKNVSLAQSSMDL